MKIRRVILSQPTTVGNAYPRTLVDVGREEVSSMELIGSVGIRVDFVEPDLQPSIIIPLSACSVVVPDKESSDELLDELGGASGKRKKRGDGR